MSSPSPSLDSLLEQCILALEANDPEQVETLLAQHPDNASELRERLAHLSALGILQPPKASPSIPEQLGEFRLLRQIGSGGMGIVYLAEQSALQRHVALKLVHPEHLFFQGARDRFRREVLAVARLHHPGIVPILTCGEAAGIPYYAMDLVPGASLAEVLVELVGTAPQALDGPTLRSALQRALAKKRELIAVEDAPVFRGAWTNVCVRLVQQVADALQHAHSQGVLHRDLKPSNLLLTNTGQVRLIDFGLASAEGEQRITKSGATLGSLPYMAPEQVRGDVQGIDERTDVYQLGITFYELLTLTLPHGDGRGETRAHILAGHVDPPARRNLQVHPDAEAVCLMAMDVDPARRYAKASEFAADLQAFLDQRNVRARKPSTWLRMRRWARRHPAAAATTVAAFLVLVPGPLAFALQQSAANTNIKLALADGDEQRRRAEANLGEASRQRDLAEQNLQYALDAVETMLLRTAEARLADVPRTARLRRQLLQDAVDFHQRLAAATGDNVNLRVAKAHSQSLLGSLHTDLGELDQALPLLEEARSTLESLLPETKHANPIRYELARCNERLAVVLGRTERTVEFEAAQARAMLLFRELAEHEHTARNIDAALNAQITHAKALAHGRQHDLAKEELDDLDRRIEAVDGSARKTLTPTRRVLLWTDVADSRGLLLARGGDIEAASAAFAEALRRIDTLPAEAATAREVRTARVGVLERLGLIYEQQRRWSDASPLLDRACAEYEELARLEPEFPLWRSKLARSLGGRAGVRQHLGQAEQAGGDHDRAIELLTAVVAEAPEDSEFPLTLALAHAVRAGWRSDHGDRKSALEDFELAEQSYVAALALRPNVGQTIANLGATLGNHAATLAQDGDYAGALQRFNRAIEVMDGWSSPEAERQRLELMSGAADMMLRTGDESRAIGTLDEATRRADAALLQRPDDRSLLYTVALLAANHGTTLMTVQGPEAAIALWQSRLPIVQRAAATTPSARRILGTMLLRLADANLRLDRPDAARPWFIAAVQTGIRRDDVVRYPPLPNLFDRADFKDLLPQPTNGQSTHGQPANGQPKNPNDGK